MFKFIRNLTVLLWNVFWHPDYTIVSLGMFPGRTYRKDDYQQLGVITRVVIVVLQFFYAVFIPLFGLYLIWALSRSFETVTDTENRIYGMVLASVVWLVAARAFWPGIYNIPWSIRNLAKARGTKSGPQ